MNTQKALERALDAREADRQKLATERRKLDDAITAIRTVVRRPGRRPGPSKAVPMTTRKKRKPMSAAQKKAHSEAMKKAWAKRKKAADSSEGKA